MHAALKIGMASALALATALPAIAQDYQRDYPRDPQYQSQSPQYQPTEPSYQQTQQYQQDQDKYQQDRQAYDAQRQAYDARKDAYDARRDTYEANRVDYQAARAAYDQRLADWRDAQRRYDRRHGYGAYARVYGAAPVWNEAYYRAPPAATYYGRDAAYTAGCRDDHSSAVGAGIIGAIAGAALGSNIAASGHRGDGAVLGGVVGAAAGASIGNAHDKYKCDTHGPYYSYSETIPYRESRDYRSGQYDYDRYASMKCRLATAPIDRDGRDYRYVRVCPDGEGRYRITG